ncbi:MAG: MlaE family lipid ABC transporter permease subunit [Desulfobacterales bacterium]|nr:MlaE family lipid ABC transporter permease subunit [Desulfobacterales bacterium]
MGPTTDPAATFEIAETSDGNTVIYLKGRLDILSAGRMLKRLRPVAAKSNGMGLTVDLSKLETIDDTGVLLLFELRSAAESRGVLFEIFDPKGKARRLLSMVGFNDPTAVAPAGGKPKSGIIVRLGDVTITEAYNLRFMISFVGSVAISFFRILVHPRALRLGDTITCMEKTGVNALPIVGLISFLLGLVMAFMSSLQLEQFGANIYVASLVSIAMVSELGPIMTAIVVAGRSGSAFAAEIGTMKISEEVDALVTMGFEPALFLAVPRILAALIVVPLLTLFSDIFAIAGGLVVGVFVLDLTTVSYMAKTVETLTFFEVCWGAGKSLVFAVIIALVGCLRGFQTRGGADAVGNAATSAVVTSIFLIILSDSAFAILRGTW